MRSEATNCSRGGDFPLLNEKEKKRRELMLSGSQFKAILTISLPLVFYASVGQIFQLIDTFIAANMSANTISTVSFVNQLEKMLMAVASALSISGGVMIARSFGSGDMQKVRRQISTLFFSALFIGGAILALTIPLMYPILRLLGMSEELLFKGTVYSSLVVVSVIFQFINQIFFAVQKSRGSTKIIMWGNLLVLFIKTSLNITTIRLIENGVFERENGIYFLPIASIAAHFALTIIALAKMTSKKNPFRLSLRETEFKKTFLAPLASLGVPVFLEKFIFAFGKAFVNSLCATMGTTVVGALGVSDRICGLSTNPIGGFQEAESSLVSNNLGNKNVKRAISFFYRTTLLTMSYVVVFFIILCIFRTAIINAFAKGNASFAREIDLIYYWERLDTILIALNVSVMGLLYGFGKTKITMILNTARLFVYRIPVLLLFMKVPSLREALGISGVGIAMCVSNGLTGLTAGVVAFFFIRREMKRVEVRS
ncbi:MATE family efflux transporter [uncultured Treponema sp.]|uniref:MATE family efflux transporter n=1 Tax=uncultured Treponema sp. TaxID=162155 RepID=UPI0025EA76B9|nr:MATE family efflux transporter [uncultured Treponema sp.]